MRKAICSLILSSLISMLPIFSSADIDLSNIPYNELLSLHQQISQEIASRPEGQSVTVPIGLWKVGVDIPEGTWLLTAVGDRYTHVAYGPTIEENGNSMSKYSVGNTGTFLSNGSSWRLTAESGNYIYIESCPVVFRPAENFTLGFPSDSFSSPVLPSSSSLPVFDYARAYKECDTYKDSFYQFSGHVCEILSEDPSGTCYYVSASGDYSNCLFVFAPSSFANACKCSPGDMIEAMVYYNGVETLDNGARVALLSSVYIDVIQ